MLIIRVLFLFIFLFVGACDNGANIEEPSEVSCSTATGLWTITSAKCNGDASDALGLVYLLFNANGSVAQTSGITECATTFTWDFNLGTESPTLDMSGNGNLTCSSNGETTTSCSAAANSCNAQVDITGITNDYNTCVINNGSMQFTRTVSAINNPDGLSYCQNGQEELVTLVKATDINLTPPPDPTSQIAVVSVTGPNPIDFGAVSVGRDRTIAITLANSGTQTATALSATGLQLPYAFKGGTYPGTGGTCSTTLLPSASCTMYLEFSPTAVGTLTDVLLVSYHNGSTTLTLNQGLIGVGSVSLAILNISNGPFYDFGNVTVNTTATHSFTVTNSGGGVASAVAPAALTAPFQFLGGTYPGTGGTCAATLGIGATCTVIVEFAPTAAGSFNNTVRMNYNDGSMAQSASRNTFGAGTP